MSDFRIDSVCRTCLAETDELRSLFREGKVCGEITTLSDMLVECTALEVRMGSLVNFILAGLGVRFHFEYCSHPGIL